MVTARCSAETSVFLSYIQRICWHYSTWKTFQRELGNYHSDQLFVQCWICLCLHRKWKFFITIVFIIIKDYWFTTHLYKQHLKAKSNSILNHTLRENEESVLVFSTTFWSICDLECIYIYLCIIIYVSFNSCLLTQVLVPCTERDLIVFRNV